MKTFVAFALTLVLTASLLVGCGCTNQNMNNTSAPTVLPTNEELWNSTESTTRMTTEATTTTEGTDTTGMTGTTGTTETSNETQVQNHVNAHTDMMDKLRNKDNAAAPSEGSAQNNARQMVPGTR